MEIAGVTSHVTHRGIICKGKKDTKTVLKMLMQEARGEDSEDNVPLLVRTGEWIEEKIDNWYAGVLADHAYSEMEANKPFTTLFGDPIRDLRLKFSLLDQAQQVVALEIERRDGQEAETELAQAIRRRRCFVSATAVIAVASDNGKYSLNFEEIEGRLRSIAQMQNQMEDVSAVDLAHDMLKKDHWGISTPSSTLVNRNDLRVSLTLSITGCRLTMSSSDPYTWAMNGTFLRGKVPQGINDPPGIKFEIVDPRDDTGQKLIWDEGEIKKMTDLLEDLERAFKP